MSIRKIENPDEFRSNIRKKLNEIVENENKSLNLEKGIFNYALKEADRRKIVKKWDNKHFIQIYVDHLRSIITNLKGEVLQNIKNGTIKMTKNKIIHGEQQTRGTEFTIIKL